MIKDELNPPHDGLNADPILYGVAAGLAVLFPPVLSHGRDSAEERAPSDGDEDRETRDAE